MLELSIDSIHLDANNLENAFIIIIKTEVEPKGHIISRYPGLSFSPSEWTGSRQVINYKLTPEAGRSGVIETCAYICSNGGETSLPITINHAPMVIQTEEGHNISTIEEFYRYATDHPVQAHRLFASSEFYMFLLSTGYEYLDLYERFHKDVNKERGLDNFFVLSKLKSNTPIAPEPVTLEHEGLSSPVFTMGLNRKGFRYEDRGTIEITNNTGSDMQVEVYSRERHVYFKSVAYIIGSTGSIPFEIRPSAFTSAQRLFRKIPYISTYIDVRARCPGRVYNKRLQITIGEW